MNFTFPRATLIKAIPTMRFQLDDEADQSATLKDFFMSNYGEEIEITNSLLAKLCEIVDREYVFEMIQGSDETDQSLCAAFLIVMPYEMFTHGGREVCPFGSLRYSTIGGVVDNPIFKMMWEHRELDHYNMEEKLADILAQTVFNNSEGVEQIALSFKTPMLRNELCFMCDPNKYVEHLPTLAVMPRYDSTMRALEHLTSKALESVSNEPYPAAMMDAILNNAMTAIYFLNQDTTPLAYRQVKDYLISCFEDGNYTVDIDGRTAIRCGHRNKLIAFITLNKGEVIDSTYFDTMFAHIDRDLYLKASDKFRRNARSGAFGTAGRVRDVLGDAKKRMGQRIEIPYAVNPQFTGAVPKLAEGIYVSNLREDSEPLLKQLVPDDVVEVTPAELETTDAKYVIVKHTNEHTLTMLKDKRVLANYAKRHLHHRVVLVPAEFSAEGLVMLDNVHLVYERQRDYMLTISSQFSLAFGNRRDRGGRRRSETAICLNAVAYRLNFEEQTTNIGRMPPHFI
ncbi:hypothetical protein pVa21_115 [Vibrio phage pVa-21]|nr:hypothetical protein pVa21_115 [Vibrio phage pVa-21]